MQNLFNLKHNPNLNPNPNPYNSMQGFHRKKVHHSFSIYEICMTSILNLIFFSGKPLKRIFFVGFNELDSFSDSVRSSWSILFLFFEKKNFIIRFPFYDKGMISFFQEQIEYSTQTNNFRKKIPHAKFI